ncbi:MAG: hypothetical protein AABY26_05715 [Nanoarchaeota archaeon]
MEAILIESEPTGMACYSSNQEPRNQLEVFRSQYLLPGKDSTGKETLHYPVNLDIPGYQTLQRLLLLSGYEVIREGKKKEGSVQKQGTLYARVQPNQSIDVLFEGIVDHGSIIDNGFSYQKLQGPAEFTQFLRDYEELHRKKSYRTGVLGGILGGVVGGGIGSLAFLTPGLVAGIVVTALMGGVGVAFGTLVGDTMNINNSRKVYSRFIDTYNSKLLTGKEAICTALGLPMPEEEKKIG